MSASSSPGVPEGDLVPLSHQEEQDGSPPLRGSTAHRAGAALPSADTADTAANHRWIPDEPCPSCGSRAEHDDAAGFGALGCPFPVSSATTLSVPLDPHALAAIEAWRVQIEAVACGPVGGVWPGLTPVITSMRRYLDIDIPRAANSPKEPSE